MLVWEDNILISVSLLEAILVVNNVLMIDSCSSVNIQHLLMFHYLSKVNLFFCPRI